MRMKRTTAGAIKREVGSTGDEEKRKCVRARKLYSPKVDKALRGVVVFGCDQRERERDREKERGRGRERERELSLIHI